MYKLIVLVYCEVGGASCGRRIYPVQAALRVSPVKEAPQREPYLAT